MCSLHSGALNSLGIVVVLIYLLVGCDFSFICDIEEGFVGLMRTPLLMAYSARISTWNKEGVGSTIVCLIGLACDVFVLYKSGVFFISYLNGMLL